MIHTKFCSLLLIVLSVSISPAAERNSQTPDMAAWRGPLKLRPVLADTASHSIHAYFNTSPESPDGKAVLLFRSQTPEAHEGEICVVQRDTGKVTVLAHRVNVEDAHRTACQQWSCDGREVVFHDLRNERWVVVAVNVASGRERILAEGRQMAWGQPTGETVPLYGPHWNPGEYRNLELLNVRTGEITTALTVDEVKLAHSKWVADRFGDRSVSIFFPILSPDEQRVMFKLASPDGGGFRSPTGSRRMGLFCYDLAQPKFLPTHSSWGHPAWHPDSRHVVNVADKRIINIDIVSGAIERNTTLPQVPGSHPSYSPDGKLFVTDVKFEGDAGEWGVLVGNLRTGESALVHRFDNSRGATTWRRSHPHPVFSHDGRRIYFNVNADDWTRLYVAEL